MAVGASAAAAILNWPARQASEDIGRFILFSSFKRSQRCDKGVVSKKKPRGIATAAANRGSCAT